VIGEDTDRPVLEHIEQSEKGDLPEPRLPLGPRDGHVVQPHPAPQQAPGLAVRAAGVVGLRNLGQRHVVMGHLPVGVEAAVKAHPRPLPPGNGPELGDAPKAQDLRPEPMGDVQVFARCGPHG
jgi:hypothetical protein